MKLTKYEQLKDGMRVKCKIGGKQVDDAVITIDEDNVFYLCQDYFNQVVLYHVDHKGYNFVWNFAAGIEGWSNDVTDLESVEGLRAMKVGDIVIDKAGAERKVIEVLSNTFLISSLHDHSRAGIWFTFEEAEKCDLKLKDQEEQEEDITELTLEEVAKLAGKDVDKIRIKD